MPDQREILERARTWLASPFDEETRQEVRRLIESDPHELSNAFFRELTFGTGGMRGIMGVGTNRLNVYTIRAVTQGLVNYLKKQPSEKGEYSAFIGYDVRRHSQEFARETARVFAGNGIRVYLTDDICPTPLVSFGCRHYGASVAVMITASHNPSQYNGYKVYWSDGGQVVWPHDEGIVEEIRQLESLHAVSLANSDSPLIERVGRELDSAYLSLIGALRLHPDLAGSPLKILYTPLHGTGIRTVPAALQSWGYENLDYVEEQKRPDGNFTNAPSANPEEPKALQLGVQHLLQDKQDLLIATDPDADRIGVVVLADERPFPFTGNQTACLCLFHICSTLSSRGELPPNAAFIKTIVTTELFRAIVTSFGGTCIDVLTGFKYIAEQIAIWEVSFGAYQYIFGAEESYGSLFGTIARDKDAVSSACLVAEVAAFAKKEGLTLVDRLYEIYRKYGVHREMTRSHAFSDSEEGMAEMRTCMEKLRKAPPTAVAGIPVASMEDFLAPDTTSSLPKSDVLRFWLADRTKLVIRPSGTEPKIKLYAEVVESETVDVEQAIAKADQRLQGIVAAFGVMAFSGT